MASLNYCPFTVHIFKALPSLKPCLNHVQPEKPYISSMTSLQLVLGFQHIHTYTHTHTHNPAGSAHIHPFVCTSSNSLPLVLPSEKKWRLDPFSHKNLLLLRKKAFSIETSPSQSDWNPRYHQTFLTQKFPVPKISKPPTPFYMEEYAFQAF